MSTSPVSSATSVSALGDLKTVGEKFAKSRSAELVSSSERDADGSLAYTFDLKGALCTVALGSKNRRMESYWIFAPPLRR